MAKSWWGLVYLARLQDGNSPQVRGFKAGEVAVLPIPGRSMVVAGDDGLVGAMRLKMISSESTDSESTCAPEGGIESTAKGRKPR